MKSLLTPNAASTGGRIARIADYLVRRRATAWMRRVGTSVVTAVCTSALLAACGGGGDADATGGTAASVDVDADTDVSRLAAGTGLADGAATTPAAATPVGAFDPSGWTVCASEGGTCTFDGTRQVRYGTTSQAVTKQLVSRTACTNAVFGDPAFGVTKTCWVANPPSTSTETWTACAQENQVCAFTGTRVVRYGSASRFNSGSFSGGVKCSNAVFGDPLYGVFKSCSVSSVDTSTGTSAGSAAPVAVASVSLPALSASVLGTPLQLAAVVVPQTSAAPVSWTTADPTIATVSSTGLATPLRPGFTTITATVGGKSAAGTLTVRGPTPIPVRSQYVGTNVSGISYYGSNFPFADLMKSGGGWGLRNDQGVSGPFPSVLPDGTPTALKPGQHAAAAVAWDNTQYVAGRYTVLWDGDGSISFPLSRVKIVESGPRRIVVEPTDTRSQMWVAIDTTSPSNPVRNVRFLLPGTESTYATQPFNPAYLQRLAPFSNLRFMDWGRTNGSPVVEWADRSLPSDASWTTNRGVPIEVMIDLANSLHVDPWFCIPHKASDDYVRQFATLLHARLDPTLRPHVEYSNEVWNTGFSQTTWASQQSDAQGLARPWGTPSIFYAKRSVQIFKIMQAVYGSADAPRLVRVLAGQAAWTQFLQNALGYADTAANADVMAIAPYFQADSAGKQANVEASLKLTSDQVIDQMLTSVRGPIKSWMTANGALAAQYRLTMKAYESGPTDTSWSFPSDKQDAMTALFTAANNDPRMKDLYVEYFSQWKAAGGDTMNQYVDIATWGKYGLWGALQWTWQDVSTSPKYQGLMAFIAANPLSAR